MTRRTIRTAATLLAALLLAVLAVSPALAQDSNYPPGTTADADVEKAAVAAGDLQRIDVACEDGDTSAVLAIGGWSYTDTIDLAADATGQFEFEVPSDASGDVAYEIDCREGPAVLSGTFTIDNTLPITGGEFTVGMGLAAVALLLGAALVLVSRKKTREFEVEAQ